MTGIERFYKTVAREPVDRPAAWLGMPDPAAQRALFRHYGVHSLHELKLAIGDDFYAVEVPYESAYASAIHAAFNWYGAASVDAQERTLTADGCFRDCEDVADIALFDWPDPEKHLDAAEARRRVEMVPAGKVALGILWSSHFQDTCAAFGMETALANMIVNPALYRAVDERVVDFYLTANRIFYEATRGRLHAVLIGNDMGSQRGLMLSPDMVREFILPGSCRLVEQAHEYGLKVVYHSCGSIDAVIPDLIDIGVDVIHPIQALASGMEPRSLRERFGGRISFCGGVDTQDLLVNGSPEQVSAKVAELRAIFPTGLIISPSHEAILPDVPPANIRALFTAAAEMEKGGDAE